MFLVDMFNNGELYLVSIYGESKAKIIKYLYGISREVIFMRSNEETERQKNKREKGNYKKLWLNGEYIGTICKCEFQFDRCQSLNLSRKLKAVDERYTVVSQ